MRDESLAAVSRQLALETRSHNEAIERLLSRTNKAEDRGRGSQTLTGSKLIKAAVEACASSFQANINHTLRGVAGRDMALVANTVGKMDPEVLVVITLKVVMDSVLLKDRPNKKQVVDNEIKSVTSKIGAAIHHEARLSSYREQSPKLYKHIEKSWNEHGHKSVAYRVTGMARSMNKQGIEWKAWSPLQTNKIGAKMLNWVAEATGNQWFTIETHMIGKNKKVTTIYPTRELLGIRDSIMNAACNMAYLSWPMLCKPVPWSSEQHGGYLTADARSHTLVRGHKGTPQAQNELPLEMLNNLQTVAYRLNRPVLDVAQYCYDHWMEVGCFHRKAATVVESWLSEDATKEEIRDYRRYRKAVEDENCKLTAKNWQTTEAMYVANIFKDEPEFYLPWNFDYRGRVYSICTSLQPQGTDFQKSLFYFAEEGPINADWLYWHAGTTWGLDKKTHADRIAWAKDQHEMFTIIASDPVEAMPIWSKADEPWMFLAAALEIHECLIAKTKATSGLPIGVDATCSGLQHLSALTLNRDAAYQVNVVPTPVPSDGYRTVAERARKFLPKHVGDWIDRKVTKRTVMTLPYGVTKESARHYIYMAL